MSDLPPDWNADRRRRATIALSIGWALAVGPLSFELRSRVMDYGTLPSVSHWVTLGVLLIGGPLVAVRMRVATLAAKVAGLTFAVVLIAAPPLAVAYYFLAGGAAR
jgi:hypothetical protein